LYIQDCASRAAAPTKMRGMRCRNSSATCTITERSKGEATAEKHEPKLEQQHEQQHERAATRAATLSSNSKTVLTCPITGLAMPSAMYAPR